MTRAELEWVLDQLVAGARQALQTAPPRRLVVTDGTVVPPDPAEDEPGHIASGWMGGGNAEAEGLVGSIVQLRLALDECGWSPAALRVALYAMQAGGTSHYPVLQPIERTRVEQRKAGTDTRECDDDDTLRATYRELRKLYPNRKTHPYSALCALIATDQGVHDSTIRKHIKKRSVEPHRR